MCQFVLNVQSLMTASAIDVGSRGCKMKKCAYLISSLQKMKVAQDKLSMKVRVIFIY